VIELRAPAKLSVSLRVTGVRPDGYHLIDAELVEIDLHDRLQIESAEGSTVEVHSTDGGLVIPAGPDNLVIRALAAVGRTARVILHKRIPAGAGLGGGSADAAAVLRWAGCRDLAVAATLGADVPFCLVGGRARVSGIGEVVESLPHAPETLTLLIPPMGVPTPDVYAAWDRLGGPVGSNRNDLEPAALVVAPELAHWRDALGNATGVQPRLAGSGGTWFVPGSWPDIDVGGVTTMVVRTLA
jgi:4-diphosphocytidyl-2-C-methyl-D-erythritol kinase